MEKIENLPSEIQWKIIKFMRHPCVDMISEAQSQYKAYLTKLEYHLDGWRPCPPTEYLKEYEEMTLLKYLKKEQERRHWCNKPRREPENDDDDESDDDSDY